MKERQRVKRERAAAAAERAGEHPGAPTTTPGG
jgi:hypothetical protein